MALGAFDAQEGVTTASVGHIADHNKIVQEIKELRDELLSVRPSRNVLRNGDMGVAQRGAGPFTAADVHTADGWRKNHSGGTHSVTRVPAPAGTGYALNGAPAAIESTTASQAAAGDYANVHQRVEGVRTLAGKEVTLSFLAAASAGTPKVGIEVEQVFGTGGSPSAVVQTAVQAVTISTTATRYTVTFTVPSVAGKTLGTSGDDYLAVRFWQSAGSTFAARASSIGLQNFVLGLTDIQLEVGSGSPFERLSQAEQLARCLRYFYRLDAARGGDNSGFGVGMMVSANAADINVPIPIPMRISPSVSFSSPVGNFTLYDGTSTSNLTSMSVSTVNPYCARLSCTAVAFSAANRGCQLVKAGSNSPSHIDFSAEL